jgi:hypothetical protein
MALFSEIGLGSALIPNPWHSFLNPSFINNEPYLKSSNIRFMVPYGIIQGLNPKVLPDEIWSNNEDGFDLLTFYIHLSNPSLLIFNPPESPDGINISISKTSIKLNDINGDSIDLTSIPAINGISVANSSLIPGPILKTSFPIGPVYLGLGIFAGTSGYTIRMNDELYYGFDQSQFDTNTTIHLEIEGDVRAGTFESLSMPIPLLNNVMRHNSLEFTPKILVYQTIVSSYFHLNSVAAIPDSISNVTMQSDIESFLIYPGSGIGLGARLDGGLEFTRDSLILGFSILNIAGINANKIEKDESKIWEYNSELEQVFILNAAYDFRVNGIWNLLLVTDTTYHNLVMGHVGAMLHSEKQAIKMGVGWENLFILGIGYTRTPGNISIEVGLQYKYPVFDQGILGLTTLIGFKL